MQQALLSCEDTPRDTEVLSSSRKAIPAFVNVLSDRAQDTITDIQILDPNSWK
jgi:hypothetical protein